ncbi:MAG: type II secretion system F family protein [Candidatus Omnitrophica bacterium]|nr:type II secretion system F family protein [Candidatus Omnitrophota bacterium]
MPTYIYKAKKGPAEAVSGQIEADSEGHAVKKIEEMGLAPISVVEKGAGERVNGLAGERVKPANPAIARVRVRARDIDTFTRQLASLTNTSVPVLRSLALISRQTESGNLKKVVSDLEKEIKDGKTLSEAMREYPGIFNNLYVNMIKSGEKSGSLIEVLCKLAEYREKEQEIRQKIQAAMAYPLLMIMVGSATVFVMLTFFLPKLIGLFESMRQELPLPTKILIGISNFMSLNWCWILIAVVLLGAVFGRVRQGSKKKFLLDFVKLRVPFIKNFIINSEIAKFTRTLGLLLKSGLPVYESLSLAADTLDNEVLRKDLKSVEDEIINHGTTLSGSLKKINIFPNFARNMIAVGEESGRIDEVLGGVANVYEREIDQSIKIMAAILEPLLILIIGAIVGFIVLAMLLPVFNIGAMKV